MSYLEWRRAFKLGVVKKEEKKPKGIPSSTKKRQKEERLYYKEKAIYMALHPICEVEGCCEPSVDLHHKKGRLGKLIYAVKYFMAVCRKHHDMIGENPKWAYEMGYLISRLKNEK